MNLNSQINKEVIVKSLGWKLLERVMSQGVNLFIQIILARLLMPEVFASLAIIVAITNYAAIFVQSGLSTAIIQKEDLDDLDISTLLTTSMILALVFYTMLYIFAPAISDYYSSPFLIWPLRILGIILFLNALNSIQTAILSRTMQFKTLFFRSIIAVPISGGIGVAMAFWGFGIWALVVQSLVNILLVVIIMSIGSKVHLHLGFSLTRAKKLYLFSGKILLSSLVSGLNDTIRTMTIAKVYTKDELAYYDKAYTYSGYITLIINSSISSVLLPVLSRNQTNIDELRNMARRSVRISAFIMFPMLLGVAAISRPIVLLLLTDKWEKSIPYLAIFCILRLPGVISSIDKQVYFAIGKSEINLFYEIGLMILNISILMFSVRIGTMTIAIGAMMVELLGGIVLSIVSDAVFQYKFMDRFYDLLKPGINSIVMAGLVWSVQLLQINMVLTILLQLVIGIITYICLAKLTKDDNLSLLVSLVKVKMKKEKSMEE